MTSTPRNIAIILALTAAVVFLPGGGFAAGTLQTVLMLAFWGTLAWFAFLQYREHRVALLGLGDQRRGLLYGALGVLALTLTATHRLWATGPGTVLWLLLVAAAGAAVFTVWQSARQY